MVNDTIGEIKIKLDKINDLGLFYYNLRANNIGEFKGVYVDFEDILMISRPKEGDYVYWNIHDPINSYGFHQELTWSEELYSWIAPNEVHL